MLLVVKRENWLRKTPRPKDTSRSGWDAQRNQPTNTNGVAMKNTESDFAAAGERYLKEHAAYNLTAGAVVRGIAVAVGIVGIVVVALRVML